MCIHCVITTLAKILGYCMILLFMLCRILAPSDISEGGGFSNVESASTSTEVDEVMDEEISGMSTNIAGGYPIQCLEDILEEDTSRMSAKIAGGYPIQCQEDILECAENAASSIHASSDTIVSGGQRQCNGNRRLTECQLIDEYIDLHPEIPIGNIQADQDQEHGDAHQQVDRPVQASMYTNFLRNPVQVENETPSSASAAAEVSGLNEPGLESGHTPMHSHSPFDGGTEMPEPIHDANQGNSGGAPNTDEFARSIRRGILCIVCKKNNVEVKFETCGHAVCCLQCASDMRQCNVCQKLILCKTYFFI